MADGEPNHHPLDSARDRETTAQIRARFHALNQSRLALAQMSLSERQCDALRLLPLLLHINHPRLPGFCGTAVPSGISQFDPDPHQLQLARKITPGFRYGGTRNRSNQLAALYVMGSVGTVAQGAHSDMDFWVCCESSVGPDDRQQLTDKTQRLSQWASGLGLEWHFFVMDADAFARGTLQTLTTESSGSAQHFLLLDEFYRSAILLAGQEPLWWYMNAANRARYSEQRALFQKTRFLREEQWLDFGPVCDVPPEEFVSAAVWQLYKAISSPHKSLLKLWLLEVYLGRYPQVLTLADKMKLLVYAGNFHPESLDPYLLLLQELTDYFVSRKEFDRLELMRQCFYVKLAKRYRDLTKPHHAPLRNALDEWLWNPIDFEHLDNMHQWNAQQVINERRKLTHELTNSYRHLLHMARTTSPNLELAHEDIGVLGRKLFASFERSSGKIERINMGISSDLQARYLLIEQEQNQWCLYITNRRWEKTRTPLIGHGQLAFVLLWAYCNGVLTPQSRLRWLTESAHQDLRPWLRCMTSLPLLPWHEARHDAFTRKASAELWVVLVNDPGHLPDFSFYSDRPETDPLNTSAGSLIRHLQLITRNSWGEIHWHNLGDSLAELIARFGDQQPRPGQMEVRSLSRVAATLIEQRLSQLLQRLHSLVDARLLLVNGDQIILWDGADSGGFDSVDALFCHLAKPRQRKTPWQLDNPDHLPDNLILLRGPAQFQTEGLQVFYRITGQHAEVLVHDECGSMVHFRTSYYQRDNLLKPLHHFLRAIVQRLPLDQHRWLFGIIPIQFYQWHDTGRWQQQHATSDISRLPLGRLHIAVLDMNDAPTAPGQWRLQAWLDHQAIEGEPMCRAIAAAVLACRSSGERYPVHITDLEIDACKRSLPVLGQLQSSHYLTVKVQLEAAINSAMQAL
ncbi:class I adenylate cyclase [Simiduia agarivorans]|uniref:Adenylate cyclase n=1 Tax=Simiduia agarivorans (strain DSM 21679 / JCM 13881 / BCRC 17597 / SA1) TaxID=1117647 RepID=K4KKJ3_SIMAS|nr:class I adenylate cyclase [Simiduia agarivorans]AFU99541.1 adenylate cyclase [Simiduia agarivorans SA1 = DSM 21679]